MCVLGGIAGVLLTVFLIWVLLPHLATPDTSWIATVVSKNLSISGVFVGDEQLATLGDLIEGVGFEGSSGISRLGDDRVYLVTRVSLKRSVQLPFASVYAEVVKPKGIRRTVVKMLPTAMSRSNEVAYTVNEIRLLDTKYRDEVLRSRPEFKVLSLSKR